MGHKDHHEKARGPARVFVLTVSDTRDEAADDSGALIKQLLIGVGHEVAGYKVVRDEPDVIRGVIGTLPADAQAIVINGGTGVSKRDGTFEAVDSMLEKRLPGFGELFRMLSYQEIGPAAIMSRATAGVAGGKVVISIPGSTGAVRLAMEKVILPELSHLIWEANK
jgi:molybdopterin adenylyltransferase